MPTYNRVCRNGRTQYTCDLVEEAIASFMFQDFPVDDCELIVLNDTPGQKLKSISSRNIHIINFDRRFPSLGDKCNYGIKIATGQYVTRWDDDDISLPDRLKRCMRRVQQDNLDVLVVQGYFYQEVANSRWQILTGQYGFQQDIYRTSIARQVRYESRSNGEDQLFRASMLQSDLTKRSDSYFPTAEELFYIYRWGASPIHLSDAMINGEQKYHYIGSRPILQLESPMVLDPHWRASYIQITRKLLADRPAE